MNLLGKGKLGGTKMLEFGQCRKRSNKVSCLFCAKNLTFITWLNKPKVNYNLSYYLTWKGRQFKICHLSQTCLSGLYDSKSSATSLSKSGAASWWLIGFARLTVNTKPNNTERTRAFIVPRHCETCRPFTEENCILAPLNCYCTCWKGRSKALDCVNLQKYLPLFFQVVANVTIVFTICARFFFRISSISVVQYGSESRYYFRRFRTHK